MDAIDRLTISRLTRFHRRSPHSISVPRTAMSDCSNIWRNATVFIILDASEENGPGDALGLGACAPRGAKLPRPARRRLSSTELIG
jgi:hypothetical protein